MSTILIKSWQVTASIKLELAAHQTRYNAQSVAPDASSSDSLNQDQRLLDANFIHRERTRGTFFSELRMFRSPRRRDDGRELVGINAATSVQGEVVGLLTTIDPTAIVTSALAASMRLTKTSIAGLVLPHLGCAVVERKLQVTRTGARVVWPVASDAPVAEDGGRDPDAVRKQPPQWHFHRFASQCTCHVTGSRSVAHHLTFHRLHFGFDQLIVITINAFQLLQGRVVQVSTAQIRLHDLSDLGRKRLVNVGTFG